MSDESHREFLQRIADRAAEKAVRDTLTAIGIDVSNPVKAQEQFAFLRTLASPRTKSNLEFLERFHTASEKVGDTSWRTVTRILVACAIGFVGIALKDHILAIFSSGR